MSLKGLGRIVVALSGVLLITHVANVSVVSAGESEGSRWTAKRVMKLDVNGWYRASLENQSETRELVHAWLKIAGSAHMSDGHRLQAIKLAVKTRSNEAIEFCVEHLRLRIKVAASRGEPADELTRPCLWALRRMGWVAVPHLLSHLARVTLDEASLSDVGTVLEKICSRPVALGMLQGAIQQDRGAAFSMNARGVIAQLRKR